MKTFKTIFTPLLVILTFFTANAQVHPWEKYGFDPHIITLSNGKYQEFHDLKTVVEIGSVLYNTETKKIIGFVGKDTLNESGLKPHIVSRWISPDPLSQEYLSWSPYHYAMNNPIRYTDVLGMGAGDFYDEDGKYLGTDGKDDGKLYVVTDKQEKKQIKTTNKAGGTTQVDDVKSETELPSANVRGEMKKSVDKAGSPSFHEEGGFFGTKEGGGEYVVHAKAGETADPSIDPEASINVFVANNKADLADAAGGTINGTFHTHPDGTVSTGATGSNQLGSVTTHGFMNEPSNLNGRGDIPNAQENRMGVTGNHYVLAQGNKTVYIYNGGGTVAKFPFKQFFSIGIKK